MENKDWEILRDLAESNDFTFPGFDLDWSTAAPFWLMAEMEGKVVGAIQLSPGRPIGRLEYLFLNDSIGQRSRALTVRGLTTLGTTILARAGAQIVCGMIQDGQDGFAEVAGG